MNEVSKRIKKELGHVTHDDSLCTDYHVLRYLSRLSPVTNMEIIEFQATEMVTCHWYILSDLVLKQFCDFIKDSSLGVESPGATQSAPASQKTATLNIKKQLVLVRSCIADVLYAMHCLGLWCARKTVRLYLTEFARLLQNESQIGDLISGAVSVLNSIYGRLETIQSYYESDDPVIDSATPQLKALLDTIKSSQPHVNTSSPICIIHVRRRVIAKVIALWLHKVADSNKEYSFIRPNYVVGSNRKHRNRMAVDNFDLHHEAAVREFRCGDCNLLVSSAINERCTNMPRCNLVISFDLPPRFTDFVQAKSNCRYESSKYVIIFNRLLEPDSRQKLLNFLNIERLLNGISKRVLLDPEETKIMEKLEPLYPPYPSTSDSPATVWRAMNIINKYCTKLPSDSFTKLTPEFNIKELMYNSQNHLYCEIRLPINSPVRQTIVGPPGPTKNIATRLAAFTACKVLHQAGELDDNMLPITKESMRMINSASRPKDPSKPRVKGQGKGQSIGTTKHRQYYKKRIAKAFSGPQVTAGEGCYLYKFHMVLNCPIPDEQNRRGRRIIDPSETNRNFAIVCTTALHNICSFPLFTRSGEVFISVELIRKNIIFTEQQVKDLRIFHEYTFSKVLKLEKYPIIYDPNASQFTVLLAPVIDLISTTEIDWNFVTKIVHSDESSHKVDIEQRKAFKFNHDDYIDAVVIPWYRLTDRQQFAYYVAEICTNLNPQSPFPDEESGFKTFVEYYRSKYKIEIFHKDQPILDVDHTSARLNLLTPRYVNRKGRTLPSSTAKTRRESRESLVQKQLLIPELCSIHPFPASFWRKAVCLPCIFYRANSLFLAEELRRQVAQDTKVGFVEPPKNFQWPPLNFGWSLRDVIKNQASEDDSDDLEASCNQQDDIKTCPTIPKKFGSPSCSSSHDDDYNESISEEELCYHGKWKDSKTRHQPLLRELFIPCRRVYGAKSNQVDLSSETFEQLDVKVIRDQPNKSMEQILPKVFGSRLPVHEEEAVRALLYNYDMIRNLDQIIEDTLDKDPDLFKDNEMELIAVDDSFSEFKIEAQPTFGELLPDREINRHWPYEEWKNIKFDPTRKELLSNGLGPNVILQALTMSNASDGINLERLETVGDSFLKYSITAYLYCMYPSMNEGKLSFLRSTEISNANLYELGRRKNLGELMLATKFEPSDNWLAPGYTVAENATKEDNGNNKKREIDKALAEVPYDLLLQHSIPDKSIADCVEALIGAYLTASGSRAALLFMNWLGLKVVPPTFDIDVDIAKSCQNPEELWRWLGTPQSPLIIAASSYDENALPNIERITQEQLVTNAKKELDRHYTENNLAKFERDIQYEFNDKAYLVQAFTHNSYYENHVTDCHQRLEFLGDALLDYLITRYLFEDPRCHSPGTLTDLRSALVNNTFFASLAVKYNFHQYLKYFSDDLRNVINEFVKKFGVGQEVTITKGYTLLVNEGESEYAEDIEVPKALGDVFESVAGAIYLDSGLSLDTVWRVYFKMMKPEIEYFSKNVPKSPIRELLESMPQNVRFSPSELAPDKKHQVIAEVFGLGRFIGVGRSKHSAKSTAAKRALRMLPLYKKRLEKQQAGDQEQPDTRDNS